MEYLDGDFRERVSKSVVVAREECGIEIQCDCSVRMPQGLTNNWQRNAGADGPGSIGVAKIMRRHVRSSDDTSRSFEGA